VRICIFDSLGQSVEDSGVARSATRPIVGVTSYAPDVVEWGPWHEPAIIIPSSYVRALTNAGARPLIVPPDDGSAEQTLDLLDGVVFSGGTDIDPAAYGAEADPSTDPPAGDRDRAELALLGGALARDMPLLAVCRGSQLLNIARGGDLVQHLPDEVGHEGHRPRPGTFTDHDVRLEPESVLAGILGRRVPVKSHHHQGFGRLGRGLDAVGWAEDGTVEALEDSSRRFALGVLWHPEEAEDPALFDALVASARAYRAARGR
jgi:gamma-glutamyl-gamma-aminobutyrate hydrolase PuuD